MKEHKTIATRHFMLCENFLQLVENILIETLKDENKDTYIGAPIENIQEHYRQLTRWSDFRILVPTLFNFFHGIELLLKAANYKVCMLNMKPNHKLSDLFEYFKINYPNQDTITNIIQLYIYPSDTETKILKAFYRSNNIVDSSQFYEIFKYPYSKDFKKQFNYFELKNLGTEGITFFNKMISDIQAIRIEIEKM